jgi:SAM-dependent methyltransferase
MTGIFGTGYADTYDVVYRDKDYAREVAAIDRLFERHKTAPIKSVLDLGCGTGRHAILLARRDLDVVGVDQSEAMLEHARKLAQANGTGNSLTFIKGDVRNFDAGKVFDAALMMFNVLGYLTSNDDLLAGLRSVRGHLRDGGLFIFDIWYGPAVVAHPPVDRIKEYKRPAGDMIRLATGKMYPDENRCDVSIRLITIDNNAVKSDTVESHPVRYFFPLEIDLALRQAGFRIAAIQQFPDVDERPDLNSWPAVVVAVAEPVRRP